MVWAPICSGLQRRPPEHEQVPRQRPALRTAGSAWLAVVAVVLASIPARAEGPDLLPNERAFAFAARGAAPQAIDVRFTVARGYYLYRDKLKFSVEGNAIAADPLLPPGENKHDEFFGDSVTYRGTVLVRLALRDAMPGRPITVVAESQGCADVGVCYPPQRQRVAVTLPSSGAPPTAFVPAVTPARGWFH